MTVKLHNDMNEGLNWERNWIQFPRLIAEIKATQKLDVPAIAVKMDLPLTKVYELLHSAEKLWSEIQERSK